MGKVTRRFPVSTFVALIALVVVACGGGEETPVAAPSPPAVATPTSAPTPARNPLAGVQGIVNPENRGWPREVEGLNGRVTIAAKPNRIVTLSLGHDEVTYGLVPASRVVAVGAFTKDPDSSNVADLAKNLPTLPREPEQVIAQRPDIVIASAFSRKELIEALTKAGLTVVQMQLRNDLEGRINDMLLMGYIYGEEQRALALAQEVRARYEALQGVVGAKPLASRPRVLSLTRFTDKVYTAGRGSTEGNIIVAAGAVNVAAEAGLERNPTVDIEGIIAMRPEVIIIPQPKASAEEFRRFLLGHGALAEVLAVKNGRVYVMPPKWFTTLSFWNIRGAEELAKILWPADLGSKEFPPFSRPG